MPDYVPESREELLRTLEQISGRTIRTRADMEAYLAELQAKAQEERPSRAQRRWNAAKHATLGVGLLIALLQYYLIDVYVQIVSLQRVQFLNPVLPALQKSAVELLRLLA